MNKTKILILALGDILLLYASLFLTMVLRYGTDSFNLPLANHIQPFSLIFVFWLLIFYLADLYKSKNLKIDPDVLRKFALSLAAAIVGSIILFYLFPTIFNLTPKTNLIILAVVFGVLDLGLRFSLAKIFIAGGLKTRIAFIGESPAINELIATLKNNPQLGYEVISNIKDADMVVVKPDIKDDPKFTEIFYGLLASRVAIVDSIGFYEIIFQKLPLDEIEGGWFVEKIATRRKLYDFIKRITDIVLSLALGIIFLPFFAVIALLTKLSSRQGPIIYKQERVGLNDKNFILYKFGVMKEDNGALATAKNDGRLTFLGKILNRTHLNEIPQFYNILKGNMSFIGPRAESHDLVKIYRQIPHYKLRHMIKPGLTGWAQVNYKPSASVEEAKEKLKYDVYYIKNRSLVLDFLILLKTIRYFFFSGQ